MVISAKHEQRKLTFSFTAYSQKICTARASPQAEDKKEWYVKMSTKMIILKRCMILKMNKILYVVINVVKRVIFLQFYFPHDKRTSTEE